MAKNEVVVTGTPEADPVMTRVSASLKKTIESELAKEQATAGGVHPAKISIHGTWGAAK